MKFEMDLIKSVCPPALGTVNYQEMQRKLRRSVSDLHEVLDGNADICALVIKSGEVILGVASDLVDLNLDPQLNHFINAAKHSVNEAKTELAIGLLAREPETIMMASVMMEIAVRGILACLSIPYDDVMSKISDPFLNQEEIIREVEQILINIGSLTKEASNDDEG